MASAASQAAGVIQLVLLLVLHGGATPATDAYLYLFTLGSTPTFILVVGVMYPLLLNGQRITSRGLRRIRFASPLLAALFVAGGVAWLQLNRGLDSQGLATATGLMMNAVLQARVFFRAVAAEAGGNAVWIAGNALPANLAACLVLTLPWHASADAVVAMVSALVVGNTILLGVMARRGVGNEVIAAAPREATHGYASLWYLGLSSVGYTSQALLSSVAVLLPASSVTLLNLASKFVMSITWTFTNAVMPVLVHQSTDSPAAARRFQRSLAAALTALGSGGLLLSALFAQEYLGVVMVVAIWLLMCSASHVAQRTSFRFLPASAVRGPIVAMAGIVGVAAALSTTPGFNLTVLLCAYASLDAVTAALLLWQLRDRVYSLLSFLLLLGLVALAGLTIW